MKNPLFGKGTSLRLEGLEFAHAVREPTSLLDLFGKGTTLLVLFVEGHEFTRAAKLGR